MLKRTGLLPATIRACEVSPCITPMLTSLLAAALRCRYTAHAPARPAPEALRLHACRDLLRCRGCRRLGRAAL